MRAHHFTNDIQHVLSVTSLTEDVGGNYLYHATDTDGFKGILSTGGIRAATGPQLSTPSQTKFPTISFTRDWNYASGGEGSVKQSAAGTSIGRSAIFIFDRSALESNFKTLGTSQTNDVRGLPYANKRDLKYANLAQTYDTDKDHAVTSKDADEIYARGTIQSYGKPMKRHGENSIGSLLGTAKSDFYKSKSGGEFEEAVVVPKGTLPLKGILVGFWVNPKSELINDPTVMNDPRRLEKTGPNTFVKADISPLHPEKPVRTPDEKKAQRVAGQEKSKQMAVAKKNVPTPAVAEGLTRDQQFDMIEEMVLYIAEQHNVDADDIWDDFECVDDETLLESAAWQKKAGKNKTGGLNKKGVASYRKEHPGSKLQTAVTTKPSKLKPGSKAAKRRKSFCARMGGMKGPMKDEHGKPTRKALSLRKWNC